MTTARYTVLVDREIGEQDGGGEYHDGNGERAVKQLAKELQEGWDAAGIAGNFRIIKRALGDGEAPPALESIPVSYDHDPLGVRDDYITRLVNLRTARHPLDADHIEIIKAYIREHPSRNGDGLTMDVAEVFPDLWNEIHNVRTTAVTVRLDEILAGPEALKETFAKLIMSSSVGLTGIVIRRYVAQVLEFSPIEDHPADDNEDPVFRSIDDQVISFLVEYSV